jgi:glycosyltransferase involved in cell wall biosynthesis
MPIKKEKQLLNKPLISVVMSVFNDEKNVTKAIESILNQTYQNIEFLIMDDSSTDSTFEKINSFADKRVKLYRNETNLGLTKSLNILINYSMGEFIARQDSDDESSPDRLEKQFQFLEKKKLNACTTRALVKNSNRGIPLISHLLPTKITMMYKNPFVHGTLLIQSEVMKKIGLYDEDFKYSQDYKLYRDLLNKNYTIKIMYKKLYLLNMESNISSKHKEQQKRYFRLAKKSNFKKFKKKKGNFYEN